MDKGSQTVIRDPQRLEHSDPFAVAVNTQDGIDEPITFCQEPLRIPGTPYDREHINIFAYLCAVVQESCHLQIRCIHPPCVLDSRRNNGCISRTA